MGSISFLWNLIFWSSLQLGGRGIGCSTTSIASKLLAVWHATSREIAHHCGADAAQFLLIEGGSSAILILLAALAVAVMLPLNIYAEKAPISDQFSKTTINHIKKGSPLLWVHFIFVVVVVFLDLCALDDLATELVKVRENISKLVAKIESRVVVDESEFVDDGPEDMGDVGEATFSLEEVEGFVVRRDGAGTLGGEATQWSPICRRLSGQKTNLQFLKDPTLF
ncbi:Uncharacterized protein Adt_20684 [Abeliophyllum distichum]|uniref:CSC1/OSCA1-like N-terminal transmembrane domain-containing protein n=1 Tax=Abeliophyllum distichum TaxID=126358 RepID=A0ABD1SXB6_9LAMI